MSRNECQIRLLVIGAHLGADVSLIWWATSNQAGSSASHT